MTANTVTIVKLFAHACCGAVGAIVFGMLLPNTFIHFDTLYLTFTVLFGVLIISDWFWTRRQIRKLADSETANKHIAQFLWSYVIFCMLSTGFGISLMGVILESADSTRTFNAVLYGMLTCVGIYPVVRDTKRLVDAADPG